MKRILTTLVLFVVVTTILFAAGQSDKAPKAEYTVGISKLIAHPALDAAEQGMIDYLTSQGLSISFDRQNANGDVSTASSIAQKFKSDKVSVAVGIATPSAQALAQVFGPNQSTPVVFSAVTDSAEAGLVAKNIAGVSDKSPVKNRLNSSWTLPERRGSETSMPPAKPTAWS